MTLRRRILTLLMLDQGAVALSGCAAALQWIVSLAAAAAFAAGAAWPTRASIMESV